MATWKKVLVSGSAIDGSTLNINGGVTMSATLPASTDGADLVLVQAAAGHVETRLQSEIQGVTTAVFGITGSSGTADAVPFDATSGSLTFAGNILATASNASGLTTLTLNVNTDAISGSFTTTSASIAADIATNVTDITSATASILANETNMTSATASIANLIGSASLFALSSSIIGTSNEVAVTANGAQGITIGLSEDPHLQGTVEITGSLFVSESVTADSIVITGISLVDNNAAVISGSNIFGDEASDKHAFTGSVSINGPVTASVFGDAVTIDPSDIVVQNSDGHLLKAGTALNTAISSSFNTVSSSLASGVASNFNLINSLTTTVDGLNVPNVSALEASASNGINFAKDGQAGTSIGLAETASFASTGTGLAVGESAGTITYTITPASVVGAAADQVSGSWQGQGFISSSQVVPNLPSGIASSSFTSTVQGQINFPGNGTASINSLGTGDSPTFTNLTLSGDLIVNGSTTTVNTTNLNVEDQFILLNSGALASDGGVSNDREDKDGGIIVDFGGGSGSAFFYDAQRAAWGVRGTNVFGGNQADYLGFNTTSDENTNIEPQHIVTVVSKSDDSNNAPPSPPAYGTGSVNSDLGNMHVNAGDGTIWIYS